MPNVVDQQTDFSGGENSLVAPDRLALNEYAVGKNVEIRDGAVRTRRGTLTLRKAAFAGERVLAAAITGSPVQVGTVENLITVSLPAQTPPWVPTLEWDAITDPGIWWYNIQIWDGEPGGAGATALLDTMVMQPAFGWEDYLHSGFAGTIQLQPGHGYYWRVRGFNARTNEFAEWRVMEGLISLRFSQAGEPIRLQAVKIDPLTFRFSFIPQYADSFEFILVGQDPRYKRIISGGCIRRDESDPTTLSYTWQDPITLTVTIPFDFPAGTYSWAVRGINPYDRYLAANDETYRPNWAHGEDIELEDVVVFYEPTVFLTPREDEVFYTGDATYACLVSWQKVYGAADYRLEVRNMSDGSDVYDGVVTGNAKVVDLPPGRVFIRVTARDAAGNMPAALAVVHCDVIQTGLAAMVNIIKPTDTQVFSLGGASDIAVDVEWECDKSMDCIWLLLGSPKPDGGLFYVYHRVNGTQYTMNLSAVGTYELYIRATASLPVIWYEDKITFSVTT